MHQRLAIAISGSTAAAVLAVGITAAGFAPVPRSTAQAPTQTELTEQVASVDALEPEIVYVKPAPKPKTVVVTKSARRTSATPAKRHASQVRATRRERDDDDREHAQEQREERREHEAERRNERRERDDD